MKNKSIPGLSRRQILKAGFVVLVGSIIPKSKNLINLPDADTLAVKRIYLAPDDHTDYMWAGDEAQYKQAFLDMIDYYLNQADATANNPTEQQGRFNLDGSFWVWTYERNKSASDFNRLIARIRDGHISMQLNPLILAPGGMPTEAVLRAMYYAGHLERRYNLRFPLVYAIENQTFPYGLSSLWAGAGAKYSWRGICGCATKVPSPGDREHDIYWYTGPDGRRILMKWNSMLVSNQSMGGYAEAYNTGSIVDYVDSNPAFLSRYQYAVIGAFGKGWDALQTTTSDFITVAQTNKSNSSRKVIVSNEVDFFQDFESNYGSSIPSESVSFGNEWDIYCASMAEVTARVRRSVEKLRTAEALATLVNLKVPAFMNSRTAARDLAWMDMGLYFEHDWTADGPASGGRSAWERRLAGEIESYVDTLQSDSINAFGGLIQKTGTNQRFFVFNPLSWARTDFADLPFSNTNPVHVIDLVTGQETPSQIVTVDGQRRLRIQAKSVPAVGYKVFEIQSGTGQAFANAAATNATAGTIENSILKLTVVNRGAITSLIDKTRSNKEFARTSNGRGLNHLGTGTTGTIQVENAGPVSATLLVTTSVIANHTSRITLFLDSDRIEVRNDINQNFSQTFTWGYEFNLNSPVVWHEELGAVIKARLLSDGGQYSPRNARYDWLTLNHFADINSGSSGVTLSSADCNFMQVGNSTPTTLDVNTPLISILAGGQVDGTNLGIKSQGGDTHFLQRFALRTHDAFDPVKSMMFALEHQNPLVTGMVTGGSGYPEKTFSLVSIDNPNVLLWALKPADDGIGRGIVARVWNLSQSPANFALSLTPGPIVTAQETTHIETPISSATLSNGTLVDSLSQSQMNTYLLSMNELNFRQFIPRVRRTNMQKKTRAPGIVEDKKFLDV